GFGIASTVVWEVEYGKASAMSTGVATAVVRVVAKAAAGASGMGDASATVRTAFPRTANATGEGAATATAEGITWSDSGITKTGNQSIPEKTWTLITGWAARSGYPGTVITSNGIQVPAGTYTISGQVQWLKGAGGL